MASPIGGSRASGLGYLGQGNSYLQDAGIHSPGNTWTVEFQALLPPHVSALDGAFSWIDAGYGGSIGKISVVITDLSNGSSFQYLNGSSLTLAEQWYNFSTLRELPLNVSATYRVTLGGWCSFAATCLLGDGNTSRRALFLAFNRSTELSVDLTSPVLATVGAAGSYALPLAVGASSLGRVSTWTNSAGLASASSGWTFYDNLTLADTTHATTVWQRTISVTQPTTQDWVAYPQLALDANDAYTLTVVATLVGATAAGGTVAVGGSGHEALNLTVAALPFLSISTENGALPLPVLANTSPALLSGPGTYSFLFDSGNGSLARNSSTLNSSASAELPYNWSGSFAPSVQMIANVSHLLYVASSGAAGPWGVLVGTPPPMRVATDPSPPDGKGPLALQLTAWMPPRGALWHYTVLWGTPGGTTAQNGTGNASWTYPASPLGVYPLQVTACVFPSGHTGGNTCEQNPNPLRVSTEVTPFLLPSRAVSDAGVPVSFAPSVVGGSGSFANFSWNFGDGSRSYGNLTMVHTFGAPGTYPVNLTVTDTQGNLGSRELAYTVAPPLWANLSAMPTAGPAPLPVELQVGISGGTSSLGPGFPASVANATALWTFPDGTRAAGALLTHVFPYPGAYVVHLWVNDTGGTSIERNITVHVSGEAAPVGWTTPRGPVAQTGASDAPGPASDRVLATASLGAGIVLGTAVLPGSPLGGAVVLADANGTLWALDPLNLSTLWRTSLSAYGETMKSGPSVAQGYVFVLGGSASLGRTTLFAFNATTGALGWSLNVDAAAPPGLLGAPVPALGNVYVASPDYLSGVNATTGALLWQEGLFGTDPGYTLAYGDLTLFGQSPPTYWGPASVNAFSLRSQGYAALPDGLATGAYGLYSDGMVTLAGPSGHLEGAVSGTPPYWDVALNNGSRPLLPAALADGRVFATDGSTPLRAFSALNGTPLWTSSLTATSAPVVGGGSVYAGVDTGSGGGVAAFGALSGTPTWVLDLSAPVRTDPALADGILYVVDDLGHVYAIGDPPLTVTATSGRGTVDAGFDLTFRSTVTGGDGSAVSVGWLFSDGSVAAGPNVSHAFVVPGTAWARCVATDTSGEVSLTSEIALSVLPGLEVALQGNSTRGSVPLAIELNVSARGGSGTYAAVSVRLAGADPGWYPGLSVRLLLSQPGAVEAWGVVNDSTGDSASSLPWNITVLPPAQGTGGNRSGPPPPPPAVAEASSGPSGGLLVLILLAGAVVGLVLGLIVSWVVPVRLREAPKATGRNGPRRRQNGASGNGRSAPRTPSQDPASSTPRDTALGGPSGPSPGPTTAAGSRGSR